MSDFQLFLQLGLRHILDLNGIDHIMFIASICLVYKFKDFKKVAVLVTAFTLGHSITLALVTLGLLSFNTEIIENLIPITIIASCVYNSFFPNETKNQISRYLIAASFGLIHGVAFSTYLKSLIWESGSLTNALFAFNLGLEIGQLVIVGVMLSVNYLAYKFFNHYQLWYIRIFSLLISLGAIAVLLG